MRRNKKAMLAAGLLAGMAMMTGCTADTRPAATQTPQAEPQQTAQPATAQPATAQPAAADASTEEADAEEAPQQLTLKVDGKALEQDAVRENGDLLLPLVAAGEALGWKAQEKTTEEETQTRREITLEKENSRITVSYEVSDNTIRRISWQKDGLLVPVDTRIEMKDEKSYVPPAFFEEAMGVTISEKQGMVEISSPEPMETPQTNQ